MHDGWDRRRRRLNRTEAGGGWRALADELSLHRCWQQPPPLASAATSPAIWAEPVPRAALVVGVGWQRGGGLGCSIDGAHLPLRCRGLPEERSSVLSSVLSAPVSRSHTRLPGTLLPGLCHTDRRTVAQPPGGGEVSGAITRNVGRRWHPRRQAGAGQPGDGPGAPLHLPAGVLGESRLGEERAAS